MPDKTDLWDKGFGKQTQMHPGATLEDYWRAPGGDVAVGLLSCNWQDKPHRLLYDLIGEILHLRLELEQAQSRINNLEARSAELSWKLNPDRMGGAFTEEEIKDATTWR